MDNEQLANPAQPSNSTPQPEEVELTPQERIQRNKDIVKNTLDRKEAAVKETIARMQEVLLKDLSAFRSNMETRANRAKTLKDEESCLDWLVNTNDKINGILGKANAVYMKKEVLYEIIKQVTDYATKALGKEEAQKAKDKFDLICNYAKREADGIPNTGEMYCKDLCLYLMSKTFKKSAVETFETFFMLNEEVKALVELFKQRKKAVLGALGGGPGSDLSGALSFLSESAEFNYQITWDLRVYDFMSANWEAAASEALKFGLYKNFNGLHRIHESKVKYFQIDFKDPSTINKESLKELDVMTVAWALNEAVFNENFWTSVLDCTPNTLIIFVEGKAEQLVKIDKIAEKLGRNSLLLRYEIPRKLIVYTKK